MQTHAFVEKWHKQKKVLLPVVVGDILELRHYTGKSCLQEGSFHIEEPSGENYTDYQEIELAIIPGISFDKKGNRLGRGKGYYDKYFSRGFKGYKLGLAFSLQEVEEIEIEETEEFEEELETEE